MEIRRGRLGKVIRYRSLKEGGEGVELEGSGI